MVELHGGVTQTSQHVAGVFVHRDVLVLLDPFVVELNLAITPTVSKRYGAKDVSLVIHVPLGQIHLDAVLLAFEADGDISLCSLKSAYFAAEVEADWAAVSLQFEATSPGVSIGSKNKESCYF